MATGVGNAGFVEIAVIQHRAQRVLPAGGSAVDAHMRQVHEGVRGRRRLDPEDAIGQTGIAEIFPADILEFLRAARGPHAIHLHNDKSPVRQFLLRVAGVETLGCEEVLRPGVNIFNDGISFLLTKIPGFPNHAVDVSRAIAAFGAETLRRFPAGSEQRFGVGFLQLAKELAIAGAPQLGDGRQVNARPGVEEVAAVGRE